MKEPVHMRLAQSSDLDCATDLHLRSLSSDQHVLAAFGRGFVKATYQWQISDPKAWLLVAEDNAGVIGFLGMCDGPFSGRRLQACLWDLLGALICRPQRWVSPMLWRMLWRMVVGRAENSPGMWALSQEPGVAQMTIGLVAERARGLGVFPAMLEACVQGSRSRGTRGILAMVHHWNKACLRAFEKAGWSRLLETDASDTAVFLTVIDPALGQVAVRWLAPSTAQSTRY
jgi:GNAT superfamily N-acetyltransferase